jgi:hypothetical protein
MTLYELADILRKDLVGRRYNNQDTRFIVKFEGCETQDSASSDVLAGTYGSGKTWEAAAADYALRISGKLLVFEAYGDAARQEFQCPQLYVIESRVTR